MKRAIRIGTRPSRLALKQTEEICARFPGHNFEVISIESRGDTDKVTPLELLEGSDFFTGYLERALLEGVVDAVVHSAKDLEEEQPRDLVIAALTASLSPYESLVAYGGRRLSQLPIGAVVGTSSRKRKSEIQRLRPDLSVKPVRGDIEERIRQLDEGSYDALIVAHAALLRLGLKERSSEIFDLHSMAAHPLQGRLAVQVRRQDRQLADFFGRIHAG